MATSKRGKPSNLIMKKQPTQKQIEARQKFAEQARARSKKAQIGATNDLNIKYEYTITCKINNELKTCKTNDVVEALEALSKDIKWVKTRMLLKIEKDGKTFEKLLFVREIKRLFRNGLARRLFVKKLYFK